MINALGFFPNHSAEYRSSQTLSGHMYTHWLKVKRVQVLKKCLQAFVVKVNVTPPKKVPSFFEKISKILD